MHAVTRRVADPLVIVAVALGVRSLTILPFLHPFYVAFAQERAEATARTDSGRATVGTDTP